MSKSDKEFERKRQINETKKNFQKYYDSYAKQEEELISLAAQAKKEGRLLDYKQTIETLKYISSGKRKMSKYLYQIELCEILKDEGQMGQEFVKLMGQVSNETADIYKNLDVNKAKEINENNRKIAAQQQSFNDYLQAISETQNVGETDVNLDKELLDRINKIAGVEEAKEGEKQVQSDASLEELEDAFNLK